MKATRRPYQPYEDSSKVSRFLEQSYPPTDRNPNWLRARWEYIIYAVQDGLEENLASIAVWESGGEIVALVHPEGSLGEAFFQVRPGYAQLKAEMLDYAEAMFCASEGDARRLALYIPEFDPELEALARRAGYCRLADAPQVTARLDVTKGTLTYALPEGFRLTDRQACGDLHEINRVLWRGFNHEGPAPEQYVAGRADVERAPLFRKDLVVMARAPNGHLVSYCGIWFEAATRVAYVEPVATDPDYRRMGLGKAVVLEGVRRAARLGATRAIVGSGLGFYRAIGFEPLYAVYPWHKECQVDH